MVGAASEHAALSDASDSSYVTSAGHASAVLRLQMGQLLRPHVRATAFALTVRWALTAGAFSTAPVVRMLDYSSEEWVRIYATATLAPPAVGSPVDSTYSVPSNLIRGHHKDGGVRDFGDGGIEIQAPNGASGGAQLRVYRVFEELEDVYPYAAQSNDIRVQRTGATWQVVDVAGAIPGGLGTWTTAPQLGETLDSSNVIATAIYLAGFLPNAGTAGKVIGFAPGLPQMGGPTINGGNLTSKPSAFWKTGTVSSPGVLKMIDNLLLRSEDASAANRADVLTPFIQPVGPNGDHSVDLGWISFESVRLFRSSGQNYAIQVPDEARSENTLLGLYDCHLTGSGNFGSGGGTFEMKTAYRGGYISIDFIDCQVGSTEEHNFYHSGPNQNSQILRCRNETSTVFYPAHPLPDTVNGGKRIGRTGNQVVGRANKCAEGGQGPPAHETLLVEDCEFEYTAFTSGQESALTYSGCGADIIARRVALPNAGGGLFLAWVPATPAQPGIVHGFHLGGLGQFTSNPWSGSCGGSGQWGGTPTPSSIPQSGFVHAMGDVVIEDLSGGGGAEQAIRTGGCESVLVIRSKDAIDNTSSTPKIHAYPWGKVGSTWKWSSSGAGPFEDIDFRFEVPASAASVTAYYADGSSGSLSNLMGFGAGNNPANNTGGAGGSSLDTRLTTTQVDGLTVGGATAWPPWNQRMDWPGISSEISGIRFGGLYPNLSPPADYGPWKNAIYDPGKNTCTPQTIQHVGGVGSWSSGAQTSIEMQASTPIRIMVRPQVGSLFAPPDMVASNPIIIRVNPLGGYLFLPNVIANPIQIKVRPKRGHLTFSGAGGSIEATIDPLTILVKSKRGNVFFSPEMTASNPITIRVTPQPGFISAVAPLTSGGWASASSVVRRSFYNLIGRGFSIGVQYDNDGVNVFPSGRWCRLSVQHRATRRLMGTGIGGGVATGTVNRTGDMIAQLFAPIIEGDGFLLELANHIESSLRSVTLEGVTFHVPSTERIGRTPDDRWWQVNTTVPFSFVVEV